MLYTATKIPGVFVVTPQAMEDERGCFARTWCSAEFAAQGLDVRIAQCSISFNHRRGTVRGLHFQAAPHEEAKLVRATRGAIFDVAVDIRPESPTFGEWFAVELTCENRLALFVPAGCAHGFQTLLDNSEVLYQISTPYVPAAGRALRWDDPAIQVAWPLAVSMISARDQAAPLLSELTRDQP